MELAVITREALGLHVLATLLIEMNGGSARTVRSRSQRMRDQKILTALSSVFQTPQASGMPTKAQNSAALASSPPKPMP